MYFGSVKFYRHVILTTVALLIIIPVFIAVRASSNNAAMKKEIAELKMLLSSHIELKNEGIRLVPKDLDTLAEVFGVEKEVFLQQLSEKDPKRLGRLKEFFALAPSPAPPVPASEEPSSSVPPPKEPPSSVPSSASAPNVTAPKTPAKSEPRESAAGDQVSSYSSLYPDLYVKGYEDKASRQYNDDKNHVYVTFDDGPSKYTGSILNYLKKNDVPATFFVIPNKYSKARLMQILDAGHAIGIHSTSHDYKMIYSSVEAFLKDFKEAYDMIYEQTGINAQFFRFPGGSKNGHNADVRNDIVAEMTRRGFVFFDWNVDSKDIDGANWTKMYNTVLEEVATNSSKAPPRRSMILFHDWNGGYNTVLVIDDVIKALKKDPRGYVFGKIDLNVRPLNFYN